MPYPIGRVCSHLRPGSSDEHGSDVPAASEGELCIAGPGVMQGYWELPEQTAKAFLVDRDGARWYRTGDIVIEDADGNYIYAAGATAWSSGAAIASNSARSRRACTAIRESRRRR